MRLNLLELAIKQVIDQYNGNALKIIQEKDKVINLIIENMIKIRKFLDVRHRFVKKLLNEDS